MAHDKSGLDRDKYGLELLVEEGKTLTVYLVNDEKRIRKLRGPAETVPEIMKSLVYLRGFVDWWTIPIYITFSKYQLDASHRVGVADAQHETEERRIDQRLAPWRSMFEKDPPQ